MIPVTLLAGAPGAGKTTLLDTAMRSGALSRAAVVVHDPGQQAPASAILESASGCICCTVPDDLAVALLRLGRSAARGEIPSFTRVVIEAAGGADPVPLLQVFANSPLLAVGFRLEALVTVVGAWREAPGFAADDAAGRQVLLADRLVIAAPAGAALDGLGARLAARNPLAEQVRFAGDAADAAWFGAAAAPPATRVPLSALRAGGDEAISAFTLCWDAPQPFEDIGAWLHDMAERHGQRLLRVRGTVAVEDEARALAVHVIGHVVASPAFHGEPPRASRVSFVVRGLEPGDLGPPWPAAAEAPAAPRG